MTDDATNVVPLNRIEVRSLVEVAMYLSHGFRVDYRPRGGRIFMVRKVPVLRLVEVK